MPELRTLVTFSSDAFNTTEPREYFINPCCFGDDVARWLITELKVRGHGVDDEAGQEDFGWYVSFQVDGKPYTFVLGYREDDAGSAWIGWLERDAGFLASILGGRSRGIEPAAARALHAILSESPDIRDVRWHHRRDFEANNEEAGQPTPDA
jgi:hypothetical protein